MPGIPTINTLPGLKQWQQSLKSAINLPAPPRIPWNTTVASKQGGNYLTWQGVKEADGYVVAISTTGDFSNTTTTIIVKLKGNGNTSYFDSVPTSGGAAPGKRYYKVAATAGTINNPQAVTGNFTIGAVSATAIAPNDTTTASVTSKDNTTNDFNQSQTGRGKYFPV